MDHADADVLHVSLADAILNQEKERLVRSSSPGSGNPIAVLSGSVRISVPSPNGKEIVLAIIPPREVFGEITLHVRPMDGRFMDMHLMGVTA